jgi:hypothetical protein
MLTPPSSGRLTGGIEADQYWTPREIRGCPRGILISAVCPENIPDAVFRGLHPAEQGHTALVEGHRRREWIAGRMCLAAALHRLSPFFRCRQENPPSPMASPDRSVTKAHSPSPWPLRPFEEWESTLSAPKQATNDSRSESLPMASAPLCGVLITATYH